MADKVYIPIGLKVNRIFLNLLQEFAARTQGLDTTGALASLDNIGDVNASSPSGGNVLKFDGDTNKWVAGTLTVSELPSLVPSTRTITAGTGLSGGGALTADRTIDLQTAALAEIGGVLKAAASADALASAVAVTSADAATQTAAYVQADVQSIATLANELKADLAQLVTDVNAIKTSLNDLKASLRTAGVLST